MTDVAGPVLAIDSSALLRRYVADRQRPLVMAAMAQASVWAASALARSEVMLALHQGASSLAGHQEAWSAVRDDWEALWETERAAIVKEITDNGWGWDQEANKVTGPGGFEVDLSKCAAGWDPYGGLGDGKITIGQTIAQSGTLADYGNMSRGMQSYFDYVNARGGVNGRKSELRRSASSLSSRSRSVCSRRSISSASVQSSS